MRISDCRQHSDCLTSAARLDQALDCSNCEYHEPSDGEKTPQDGFSYALLLFAIFYPKVYAVYRRILLDGSELRGTW